MVIPEEQNIGIDDSDEIVKPLLAKRFECTETQIDGARLLQELTGTVRKLPGSSVKIISLVGGAGSGKTTLSRMLVGSLTSAGLRADVISTDDYNRGDRTWRWQEFEGDTPRDPLGKWDFEFMNEKIRAIRANTSDDTVVKVPTYNSATGIAIDKGEDAYAHKISAIDVLIVEGDMFRVENPNFAIYLHASDAQRLKNRLDRDLRERNIEKQEHVVNNFKLRHTNQHIPYTLSAIHSADMVVCVDSTANEWAFDVYRPTEGTS